MIRYVAFLRGINVSGQKLIKMEELREEFVLSGFKNIQTYIQSGNVIFDTKETDQALLTNKIEKNLRKWLGYEVKTVLRTIDEIEGTVKNNPFKKAKLGGHVKQYVVFLPDEPANEVRDIILTLNNDLEILHFRGRDIYWLIQNPNNEKLRFTNVFIEKKLKLTATTRNWNTVNKMLEYKP